MKLRILFLLLLSAGSVDAQQKFDVKMTVDGVEREFIVSKPTSPPPGTGYPVVLMLHGTKQTGDELYQYSGWRQKGEQENFITVFPTSLSYCYIENGTELSATKWSTGELKEKLCPGQTLKDDVTFIKMILDTLYATFSIDRNRIYASGFSNGGGMVSKLLVEMSDVFAALASHAGGMHPLDSGKAKRPLPFVYSIGTDDDQSFNYGLPAFPFNDSILVVHGALINRYLNVLGLSQQYSKDSNAAVRRYCFNTLAATAGWEFNHVSIKGVEHEYPKSGAHPVGAADFLWEFFQLHSLPLNVATHDSEPLRLRPNPARRFVTIDNQDARQLTMRSLSGSIVFTSDLSFQPHVTLPILPAGIYFAEILTTDGRLMRSKLIIE